MVNTPGLWEKKIKDLVFSFYCWALLCISNSVKIEKKEGQTIINRKRGLEAERLFYSFRWIKITFWIKSNSLIDNSRTESSSILNFCDSIGKA